MQDSPPLPPLLADIDERVQSIRRGHPEWLCGKGCDLCCRRLAEPPRLTSSEWTLLEQGLTALPAEQQREISQRVAALAAQDTRPVICPMLDQDSGACPVYAHRPVACRTYGFYVQRELGLYCAEIEARVAGGALADVVWGNHDAIDRQLAGLGESHPLTEWFAGRKVEQ